MKLKISKNDFVVCIFFFLISLCKGIGLGNSSSIYFIIYLMGILVASIKLFKVGFNKKELINIAIIIILGILDYIFGNESTILFTAISILFLKNIECDKIIKALFLGRLFGFVFMIILPCLGLMDMNTISFYRASAGGSIIRYAFGYSHPNYAHSSLNLIIIMYIYLYFERLNVKKIVFLELVNYIFYNYTYSRTGFLILTLFLLLSLFTKYSSKVKNSMPKILNFTFIFSILISFLMGLLYGKVEILNKINEILTGRLSYMNIVLKGYMPQLIKTHQFINVLFDNGYFDLLYNGGILASIWFVVMQIKTNLYIKENKMYREALLTNIFFIYCITESYYVSSVMNISLLFFAMCIFKRKSLLNNK